MARVSARRRPERERILVPSRQDCPGCGGHMRLRYENRRDVVTLSGGVRLRLRIRWCEREGCPRFHVPYRPEAESALALPQHEFGLDVIALVGELRHREHRSVPEIHVTLRGRGVEIAERSVTNLLDRYDELLATSLTDTRCRFRRRRPPIPISSRPPFQSDGGQARSSSQVDFAHVMVRQSGSSSGAQFAQTFPLELDAMGGMDNAVKDRLGQGGITHDFIPTPDWHLAGDDQRAGVVAILDDLQQVAALFGRQGLWSPVIQDQQIDPGELPHQSGIPAVAARQCQAGKQPRAALVKHRQIVAAGPVAQGTGQPRLASATWPGD